jgi:hypothetical protein
MRYRIETVSIQETGGIAHPGDLNDKSRDLAGRRIVHVLGSVGRNAAGETALRVLTEEAD